MERFLLLVIVFMIAMPAGAQHGTAPAGYYPAGYNGDMWTGTLTAANDSTREITLTYTKKDKTQTFTGMLEEKFTVTLADGKTHQLKPSDIAPGTILRVYYKPKTKKVDDKKVKYYEIFKLEIVGQAEEKK